MRGMIKTITETHRATNSTSKQANEKTPLELVRR